MEILQHYQHLILTEDQKKAVAQLQNFVESDEKLFILKGYAGTGKTTILKGFVDYLRKKERLYQLMAPTGRAAKVISQKTAFPATTVHKGIYSFDELKEIENNDGEAQSFLYQFKLWNNTDAHRTIFIVDEASMLSDVYSEGEFFRFGSGHLLSDLITESRILDKDNTSKILFIGDSAQLPPVGMNFSPALDSRYIQEKFGVKASSVEMTEVKRQDQENSVLKAATKIRNAIHSGYFNDFDLRENGTDIFSPAYAEFMSCYRNIRGKKIVITYKNKTALDLNIKIRENRFGGSFPVLKTDIVISGSNNYSLGIMNGEFAVVSEAGIQTESREIVFNNSKGGKENVVLTWRMVTLLIPGEENETKSISGFLLENYLYGDNYLKPEEYKALYVDFKNRHPKLKKGTVEFKEAITKDAYFNCFMLKFGYAVTCHKAQGGEWENVMVFWDKNVSSEFDFFNHTHSRAGKANEDFYRWAYTAVTRTSSHLYCINPPTFSSFSTMNFIDAEVQDAVAELTGKNEEIIEIEMNPSLEKEFATYALYDLPVPVQHHFIKRWYALRPQFIDVETFEIKGYEARYIFVRESEKCGLKYWFNAKNEFRKNLQIIPSLTNSDSFAVECLAIIDRCPEVVLKRNTVETVLSELNHIRETEETLPFLQNLKEAFLSEDQKFQIAEIEHLNYRERYTFQKGPEKAVVDFEYNSDGFFGRVLPLPGKCNSPSLLENIKNTVNTLIHSYAVITS